MSNAIGGPTDITERFVLGLPMRPLTYKDRVREEGGLFTTQVQHQFYPSKGTARLSYADRVLYSYEHWALAVYSTYQGAPILLCTSDGGPSKFTNKQLSDLRWQAGKANLRVAYLPFSLLDEARSCRPDLGEIQLIDQAPDETVRISTHRGYREHQYCGICYDGRCVHSTNEPGFRHMHRSGALLFRHRERYYLTGLDPRDPPNKRNYFLVRLPEGTPIRTTTEAAALLWSADTGALYQGQWCFTPAPEVCVTDKSRLHGRNQEGWLLRTTQAKLAAEEDFSAVDYTLRDGMPLEAANELHCRGRPSYALQGVDTQRYVATCLYVQSDATADHVYVQGCIRDARHGRLKLGNGKTWYRATRVAKEYWETDKNNEVVLGRKPKKGKNK